MEKAQSFREKNQRIIERVNKQKLKTGDKETKWQERYVKNFEKLPQFINLKQQIQFLGASLSPRKSVARGNSLPSLHGKESENAVIRLLGVSQSPTAVKKLPITSNIESGIEIIDLTAPKNKPENSNAHNKSEAATLRAFLEKTLRAGKRLENPDGMDQFYDSLNSRLNEEIHELNRVLTPAEAAVRDQKKKIQHYRSCSMEAVLSPTVTGSIITPITKSALTTKDLTRNLITFRDQSNKMIAELTKIKESIAQTSKNEQQTKNMLHASHKHMQRKLNPLQTEKNLAMQKALDSQLRRNSSFLFPGSDSLVQTPLLNSNSSLKDQFQSSPPKFLRRSSYGATSFRSTIKAMNTPRDDSRRSSWINGNDYDRGSGVFEFTSVPGSDYEPISALLKPKGTGKSKFFKGSVGAPTDLGSFKSQLSSLMDKIDDFQGEFRPKSSHNRADDESPGEKHLLMENFGSSPQDIGDGEDRLSKNIPEALQFSPGDLENFRNDRVQMAHIRRKAKLTSLRIAIE